ncbi:MAG: peptidoglycan endopeptidase, partial [Rhodospirillales bacterium]|nr:peptidoglycan endopeptidase [Rhodospirillales bacterium]
HASHVGVVVAPGWMLHVETGIDAALERYREGAWPHQTAGIYRWEGAR